MKKKIIAYMIAGGLAALTLAGCSAAKDHSGPVNARIESETADISDVIDAMDETEVTLETQPEPDIEVAETLPETDTTENVPDAETTENTQSTEAAETENTSESTQTPAIPNRPNATEGTGDIKELEVGDVAPDFTVSLTNGETFTLSDHDDKVVLINFWATWCPPCVGELPDLGRLSEDITDGFELVCVNCLEDNAVVDDFVSYYGYDFNIAYDYSGAVSSYYPTQYVPYTVIVKNGYVYEIFVGAPRDPYSAYKSAVEEAMANQ
ncbi:MAG: redoxin family protein [Lachnospiraceae bacterium]|nr:redoxin family protein [Lachnospiraceae bacterium]